MSRVQIVIAINGTRGDYTSPDGLGSLFLTQSTEIYRLGCGAGCSIGGTPTVPEPSSFFLFGTVASLVAWKFKRKLA